MKNMQHGEKIVNKKTILAAILAVLLILSGTAALYATGIFSDKTEIKQNLSQLKNWDKQSTPLVTVLKNGKTEKAQLSNPESKNSFKVDKGKYDLSFISPVNSDGSIYKITDTKLNANKKTVNVTVTAETVPADKVKVEDYKNILENLNTVIENKSFDKNVDTTDLVKKVSDNIKQNKQIKPENNADLVKIVEKTENNAKKTDEANKKAADSQPAVNDKNTSKTSSNTPANTGKSQPAPSASKPAAPSTPAKSCHWETRQTGTERVMVDPGGQPIYEEVHYVYFHADGYKAYTDAEIDAHAKYIDEMRLAGKIKASSNSMAPMVEYKQTGVTQPKYENRPKYENVQVCK